MFYILVLVSISALAGVLGGITGTGGILIPPILIEVFGASPHVAMGTAQASYVLPSLLGVILFLRKGQFDREISLPLAVSGCICTFLSAQFVKPHLNGAILTLFLALCIVAAGAFMLKPARHGGWVLPERWRTPCMIALGGVVGVMSGITGSGSSAILVPVMVACGLNILVVIAACMAFSVLASGFGTIGNMLNDAVDWHETFWLIVGQFFGLWAGVSIAQRINIDLLRRVVAFVCLGTGLFVLVKSITLLSRT